MTDNGAEDPFLSSGAEDLFVSSSFCVVLLCRQIHLANFMCIFIGVFLFHVRISINQNFHEIMVNSPKLCLLERHGNSQSILSCSLAETRHCLMSSSCLRIFAICDCRLRVKFIYPQRLSSALLCSASVLKLERRFSLLAFMLNCNRITSNQGCLEQIISYP
jgi:hypothetical protein